MRILLDTCIILDAIQERKPFFESSKKILELVKNEELEAFITVKSVMDIHYVVKHTLHDEVKTRVVISDLFDLVGILDSKAEEARDALYSSINDYKDALMVKTAIVNDINMIVTRNVKDYKNADGIKAIDPEELLRKLTI